MTLPYAFHRDAEAEFNDATEYYQRINPEVARTFVAEVTSAIDYILAHPEASSIAAGTVRRKIVRRFPYVLLYSIRPDMIRILAVMHQSRRPNYWLGRE